MADRKWNFDRCKTCGEYGFTRTHKCPPMWQVIPLDELSYTRNDPDYWKEVYAGDARKAAVKYIEQGDRSGAEFSEIAFVVVREPGEPGTETFHKVTGELEPIYEATALDSLEDARTKYKEWFCYDPMK